MRQIPYGQSNFEKIISSNWLYVDKTQYIEKLESQVDLSNVFYLRPGRFGKSLFTSMLDYYYAIDKKDKFNELFDNLYIGKKPTENKSKYYILKFDFSGMDTSSQDTLEYMQNRFTQTVKLRNRKIYSKI